MVRLEIVLVLYHCAGTHFSSKILILRTMNLLTRSRVIQKVQSPGWCWGVCEGLYLIGVCGDVWWWCVECKEVLGWNEEEDGMCLLVWVDGVECKRVPIPFKIQ